MVTYRAREPPFVCPAWSCGIRGIPAARFSRVRGAVCGAYSLSSRRTQIALHREHAWCGIGCGPIGRCGCGSTRFRRSSGLEGRSLMRSSC